MLFEDGNGDWIVVEVKLNKIGRNAVRQIKKYIKDLEKLEPKKNISGIIVCPGLMSAYEDEIQTQSAIKILAFGWELRLHEW